MHKQVCLAALIALLTTALAVGASGDAHSTIPSILGTWIGTWTNVNHIQTGTGSFVVQRQAGPTIEGFFCWDNKKDPVTCSSNFNDRESWTGTMDSSGTLTIRGQLGDYRGRLSADGSSIAGTYQNRGLPSHRGTWQARRRIRGDG